MEPLNLTEWNIYLSCSVASVGYDACIVHPTPQRMMTQLSLLADPTINSDGVEHGSVRLFYALLGS